MPPFIGRKKELEQLNRLLKKTSASLVVLKGRRRIGKSRLIQEFGKDMKTFIFSGLPPTEQTTLASQLQEFGWQLGKALGQPPFKEEDWNDLFLRLAFHTREGRVVILLDEISWMGSKDPHFLGKLKNAWDLEFKNNPNLILVLCGSVSSWIEKNILSHTGFLGRISLNLTLGELPLFECNQFWGPAKEYISAYEKFKILSVTGGVPKYLEEIHPEVSAEENIKNLCFEKSGFLFNEFNQIFTDIFQTKSDLYKKIVLAITEGFYGLDEIYKRLNVEKSGVISKYLEDLILSGFVRREYTWHLKNGKASKLSRYRLSDNYLRFYLKYILIFKDQIERDGFFERSLTFLPGWETIMGLQFENMVLNNRAKIMKLLNISPNEVVFDNPFFQSKTKTQEGCQIDYLIQTRFDTLYVCEIKFSKHEIGSEIIQEMNQKLHRLKIPQHISKRPVLIHVNGLDQEVVEKHFFSNVIDFSELLKQ